MSKQETYQDYEPGYPEENNNQFMHDWVFHHNPFTSTWCAIPRHLYTEYWSNYKLEGILRSNSLDTLIEILYKTKGDENKITKLVNK